MTTIKEIITLAYLATIAVIYVIFEFKLTDRARSSRLFFDYVQKQSWFVVLSWCLLVYLIGLKR